MKLEFSPRGFEKKTLKYQILLKSVEWEPSFSMQADGRTHEANSCFSLFCALA
jgi:hypothetical protein